MIGLEKLKARNGEVSKSARALDREDMYNLYYQCIGREDITEAELRAGTVRHVSSFLNASALSSH
jgi:hypothetical protein